MIQDLTQKLEVTFKTKDWPAGTALVQRELPQDMTELVERKLIELLIDTMPHDVVTVNAVLTLSVSVIVDPGTKLKEQ